VDGLYFISEVFYNGILEKVLVRGKNFALHSIECPYVLFNFGSIEALLHLVIFAVSFFILDCP
jgi:hypothetical protein